MKETNNIIILILIIIIIITIIYYVLLIIINYCMINDRGKRFKKFEQTDIMIETIRLWYKKIKLNNIICNLLLLFLLLKF